MGKDTLQKDAENMIDNQPLEGLLYDLDLMPEQCRSFKTNITRIIIEILHKRVFENGNKG